MVKKIVCLIAFVVFYFCSVNVYAQTDSDCATHRYRWERGDIYWNGTVRNLMGAGLEACYEIDYGVCDINGETLRLRNRVDNVIWVVFPDTWDNRTIRLSPGQTVRVPFNNVVYNGTVPVEVRWCMVPSGPNVIYLGDIISNYLEAGNYVRYQFYVPSYQRIVISLEGSFDTVLRLYDRNLNLLRENDDRDDGTLNSRIVTNLAMGNYTVEVSSFMNSSGGEFSLSIF